MKTKFLFLFLFSFLFLASFLSACSYTLPCPGGGEWCLCSFQNSTNQSIFVVESVNDFTLSDGQIVDLYMNNKVHGYDTILFSINDSAYPTSLINLTTTKSGAIVTNNSGSVDVSLYPLYSASVPYIDARFTGVGESSVLKVFAKFTNTTNSTSVNFTFYVTSFGSSSEADASTLSNSSSIFGRFTSIFLNLYPDSQTLGNAGRYGLVFVTMFLFTILIYFFAFKTSGVNSVIHSVVALVNFMLFLFFIGIGYVSVAVLVLIALLFIFIFFFKVKGGS